jgi:hypothetical protein
VIAAASAPGGGKPGYQHKPDWAAHASDFLTW